MPDTPSIEAEYLPAAGALVFDPNLEAGAYAPSMVASPETWFAASESLRFVGTLYGQPFTIHRRNRWTALDDAPESQPGRKTPRESDADYRSLLHRVNQLSEQLTELRAEFERIAERTVYSTALTSLASPDYELLRDIPITVEQDEDETSVSWFEIGLTGVDETPDAALMSFESRLLRLFADLNAKPDDELGPLPSRWKRTLATAICQA